MCCEEKQLRDVIFEVYYNLQIREAWADKVASKLLFKNDLYHREDQTMFVCFSSKTYICASKWIRNNAHSSIAYNRQYVLFIAKSWLSLLQLCGLWSTRLLCPWDSQAKILEWVAIPSLREPLDPGIKLMSPALASRFFTAEPPGKPHIQSSRYI